MLNKLLYIIVFISLTACDLGPSNVELGIETQSLHIWFGTEPKDLDPHSVTGVPEHNIISALLEGLVSVNPKDLSPEPGIASSWEISNDGKSYTFL